MLQEQASAKPSLIVKLVKINLENSNILSKEHKKNVLIYVSFFYSKSFAKVDILNSATRLSILGHARTPNVSSMVNFVSEGCCILTYS